jgi:hypothetical protein
LDAGQGVEGAVTKDFKREFRNLYDSVDRLHITLSEVLTRVQQGEPPETSAREHLAVYTSDLVKILQDHVEAFIESFGPPLLGPPSDTSRNLN